MAADKIAAALVEARRTAKGLAAFPGAAPPDLETAYAIQDRALALGGRKVAGWKVAMVPPPLRDSVGAERVAGPIFADSVLQAAQSGRLQVPVYDGFAALEAEFVLRIAEPLAPSAAPFDRLALAGAVASLHAGVEIASSPVAGNGDAGPCFATADHGNNAGAVLGPAIPDWQEVPPAQLRSRMRIDGALVGEGSAEVVPGGPLAALEFLANLLAGRGIAVNEGDIVLTGQTTGVHRVRPGQRARVEFPGIMALDLEVVAAKPR